MKKELVRFLALCLTAALIVVGINYITKAQQIGPGPQNNSSPTHLIGANLYYAPAYATYSAPVLNTLTGTGAQTYIVGPPGRMQDGTSFAYNMAVIFNTNTPLTFADGTPEVVTPTTVSIGPCPTSVTTGGPSGGALCANITATFANTHGQGSKVLSGDNGIFEAITDAGNNGGGYVFWSVDTGIVTLNTGALTTTTTTKVPTSRTLTGASARVTTTITTSANWGVGSTAAPVGFCSANATLTAGTTCVANQVAPTTTGTTQALEALVFTMGTSNPGAGAIKARVWGYTPVQAAF